MREGLPRSTRDIAPAEFSGERVEVFARFILAFSQNQLERRPIVSAFGNVAGQGSNQFGYLRAGAVGWTIFGYAVISVFAGPTIFDHPGPLELRQVTRDTGLPHAENFLELGHGELCFVEEEEQPESGRIGQEPEQINS
jgi:hypothetical protein